MLENAVSLAGLRPAQSATQSDKKNYAQKLSNELAQAIAADLRTRGLTGCCPDPATGGVEKEFAGGIGEKKVDVSWSSDTAGLILGVSVKTINFADPRTHNYQKNLLNRRSDMLSEAVTLHRRFPYAVLAGFLFFHAGANADGNQRRVATFMNAHRRMRMFSGRSDPGTRRDEQFESLFLGLYESGPTPSVKLFKAGNPTQELTWDEITSELLALIEERNPDHFTYVSGKLARA